MTGDQVVRVCRAVAKHLAAFADDLEQITGAPDRAEVADPQDTCKVGDADPTPDGEPTCGALKRDRGACCSRRPGHQGQHVAGMADGKVRAVWT